MATHQYIADSAPLPSPHIFRDERPASISATPVRFLEVGSLRSPAISFAIAA